MGRMGVGREKGREGSGGKEGGKGRRWGVKRKEREGDLMGEEYEGVGVYLERKVMFG